MNNHKFLPSHKKEVTNKGDRTTYYKFVTNYNGKLQPHLVDGSQTLIHINATKLPYKNSQRNTKLFKLNPQLFFPWATRIFWQDAKLLKKPQIMPERYSQYFNDMSK